MTKNVTRTQENQEQRNYQLTHSTRWKSETDCPRRWPQIAAGRSRSSGRDSPTAWTRRLKGMKEKLVKNKLKTLPKKSISIQYMKNYDNLSMMSKYLCRRNKLKHQTSQNNKFTTQQKSQNPHLPASHSPDAAPPTSGLRTSTDRKGAWRFHISDIEKIRQNKF